MNTLTGVRDCRKDHFFLVIDISALIASSNLIINFRGMMSGIILIKVNGGVLQLTYGLLGALGSGF